LCLSCVLFVLNATSTTDIYTLSLHDALPISGGAAGVFRQEPARRGRLIPACQRGDANELRGRVCRCGSRGQQGDLPQTRRRGGADRKSTRLNSSHVKISYAVFCLKKKACRS